MKTKNILVAIGVAGTNVSSAHKERDNKFTGRTDKVLVEVR